METPGLSSNQFFSVARQAATSFMEIAVSASLERETAARRAIS